MKIIIKVSYMAIDHQGYKDTNLDTLKVGLAKFRELLVNNFGNELKCKLMTAHKTKSTVEGESTEPNTTKTQIEFSNDKEFGVFEIVFDDHSNKVLDIQILDIKEPIPNMLVFCCLEF